MILCLITQTVFLMIEMIKLKHLGLKEYFGEFYAINDIIHFSLFAYYFYLRIHFLHSMMPTDYTHKIGLDMLKSFDYDTTKLAVISLLNFFLYLAMGLKIMSFMRIQSNLGQLELLIG